MSNTLPHAGLARLERRLAGAALLWLAVAAVGAGSGATAALPPVLFGALAAAGVIGPATLYFAVPAVRDWAEFIGLRALTLFQVWRIGAALVFFQYGAAGLLPQAFVQPAAWGDLAAGLLALAAFALPEGRGKYWIVHLFGFADFLVAVGSGLVLAVLAVPTMDTIALFPIALIPLFGVGLSGAAHIIALDLLRRGV